jgi:hypothetical protein
MEIELVANKEQGPHFDFISKVYESLFTDSQISFYLTRRINAFIPFPLIFKRICVIYHLHKKDAIEVLRIMEQRNWISIIPYKGVKILCDTNRRQIV